ncbi:MAG: hypothetical protein R6U97_09720, partial [Desulfosalsimonas sp.]
IENVLPYLFDEDGSPGNLVFESIRTFDFKDGIKIGVNRVSETEEYPADDQTLENNEIGLKEGWQTTYTQTSRKTNAPAEVKSFIRYMSTGETNALGLPRYVDYDDTYNTQRGVSISVFGIRVRFP